MAHLLQTSTNYTAQVFETKCSYFFDILCFMIMTGEETVQVIIFLIFLHQHFSFTKYSLCGSLQFSS